MTMKITPRAALLSAAGLFALLLFAAYANHFHNSFHFDDFHTIQNNLYIRSLSNIPKFFVDSSTFSNLPTHQVYRPALTTILALDYVRGGGDTFQFHVTTFIVYLIYLGAIYTLYLRLLESAYWALAATAVYGLHPVCAETVNYIVQRAEIMSTLGVVAGLSLYLWKPEWRNRGYYLVPVVVGLLSKPPALVFPILLFAMIYLWDPERQASIAGRAALPALIVCAIAGLLLSRMTGATFSPGGVSSGIYRMTQMRAALHYFMSFFLPFDLSADSDWPAVTGFFDPQTLLGILFLCVVLAAIVWTARGQEKLRPIAFGLFWFLVALFPTSWMPLAELVNDHRMFFPFVGLTLAVAAALQVWLAPFFQKPKVLPAALAGLGLIAAAEARATAVRNEVWTNEDTLWYDVTIKSPRNGRGLMNYGLTLMAKGDLQDAMLYFEQARVLLPAYFILEINLGIARGDLGQRELAEFHFQRALELEPNRYEPHFFYARWLNKVGRPNDAYPHLRIAVQRNPNALDARYLLMQAQSARAEWWDLEKLAKDTLRMVPGDQAATTYLATASNHTRVTGPDPNTAAEWLDRSLALYQAGRFKDCIEAAYRALKLNPKYAEAYNNIAAANNALKQWDDGIRAADAALRIQPSFELARNNRLWALSQKRAAASKKK